MALKLNERYPGRFTNPSADYPQGSFKNRTRPTAKDGSYLEKDWANDKEGFFQSLLSAAGQIADGTVDKVGASQYFNAMKTISGPDRLIGIRVFSASGTYTPTPGMKNVRIRLVGGGGGSGGVGATASTQVVASSGGAAGSFAEGWLTAALIGASQSVTIGAGGTAGATYSAGGTGGDTSLGSLVIVRRARIGLRGNCLEYFVFVGKWGQSRRGCDRRLCTELGRPARAPRYNLSEHGTCRCWR